MFSKDCGPSPRYNFTVLIILTVFLFCNAVEELCNRTPLEAKTQALPADNLFALELSDRDERYIPNKNYVVKLYSTNNATDFIAFTIFVTGDSVPNEDNPRKPRILSPGLIIPNGNNKDSKMKEGCVNTLVEYDTTPKKYVEALWQAPPKENKCVTIHAAVAITHDVWYSAEGPLLKKICEDDRNADDMPPKENNNCAVCEEARYELKFVGTWTYNTHPRMFPTPHELARFSDVVGASHSSNYYLYRPNSDADDGLKMLAEQGNTTLLEKKILEQLGSNVRTLIKATGPGLPNETTIMSFRVSRDMHLVSLVSALLPSPDWFVGVSNLELCELGTNKWAEHVQLNLYPYDAGTDSGQTFGAPNEATSPPKPIALAEIVKDGMQGTKPFAKLIVDLVRTYTSRDPNCISEPESTTSADDTRDGNGNESVEPAEPEPTSNENNYPSTEDTADCKLTPWEDLDCEGECVDGKIEDGYRMKIRYFIVNGKVVGKTYKEGASFRNALDAVPEECIRNYKTTEVEVCSVPCEEPTEEPQPETEMQRRVWQEPIRQVFNWNRI